MRMRSRKEIEEDRAGASLSGVAELQLEVLLDIRDYFMWTEQVLLCIGEAQNELRRKRD